MSAAAGHNHKLKKKKSKKFGTEPPPRVDPPRNRDPPTLTDYLLHLFDGNKLRSISPNKLNDSQFFWLLNDLGLGLSDDEVSVLCRRAPQAADHKVDWESFAPRCEELLVQTFRTRDWNSYKRKGESTYAKLQDPISRAFYFYNRANNEAEWEYIHDEEQAERVEGFVTRPEPTLEADASDFIEQEEEDHTSHKKGSSYGRKGFRRNASVSANSAPLDDSESLATVARIRGLQAEKYERLEKRPPRPDPPTLEEYLKHMFAAADQDGNNSLNADEFWDLFNGLGLGLKENDIIKLQKVADKDLDGTVSFAEFAPIAARTLNQAFLDMDLSQEEKENVDKSTSDSKKKKSTTPWVRLYDPVSGAPYYMHRITLNREWVTGEEEQQKRIGLVPSLILGSVAKQKAKQLTPPGLDAYMERLFLEQDTDNSGELDEDELWWLLHSLGLGLTDAEFRKIAELADTDKNSVVSWEEFGPAVSALLKDLFNSKQYEIYEENPWCLLTDSLSGARYYYNRQTGESEWLDGSKEQGMKVGSPFIGQVTVGKPDPPSLEEYLHRLFREHDKDDSGEIDSQEMWHVLTSLGLGLNDEEIELITLKADSDQSGYVSWEEFLPLGIDMLSDIFDNRDWDDHDTSWVKLYDSSTKAWYFFDCSNGDSEWVDGSPEQAAKVGIMPVAADPSTSDNKEEAPKPIDMNAEDAPLPFGGRQLLEALVLGKEERAKALLQSFKTERRRQRVLQHTRIEEFGFTAAHCAVIACGIEIIHEILRLQPDLLTVPALNGDTPLHLACLWKQRNAARLLVALGAEVTTKNNDGETPLDMAPPALAERLVKDLNAILSSWKGPVSYPNPDAASNLLKTEKQQRAERERKRLEEAEEEAARVREEERQEALRKKEEEFKAIALAKERELEIANGLRDPEPEKEFDDGLTRVERWAQTAESVESIKARGREVVAPNELVLRVYSAKGLFPPETEVRKGKSHFPELRPVAIVQCERRTANGDKVGETLISTTKPHGDQDQDNLKLGKTGWVDEACLLLGETDPEFVDVNDTSCLAPNWGEQFCIADDGFVENRLRVGMKLLKEEREKQQANKYKTHKHKASNNAVAVKQYHGRGAVKSANQRGGKSMSIASFKEGSSVEGSGETLSNDGGVVMMEEANDINSLDTFKLKVYVAHWPEDEDQEEAEIQRRKCQKEGKMWKPSLKEATPLAVIDLSVSKLSHPPTLGYPTKDLISGFSPIPAGGGRRGAGGEFRAWFPLEAPNIARRKDYQAANSERLREESEAVLSGAAGRSAGKPPPPNTAGLDEALALPPPWVAVTNNHYHSTEITTVSRTPKDEHEGALVKINNDDRDDDRGDDRDDVEDQAVTRVWEEKAKEIKPGGHKDIRRFLQRVHEDTKPTGVYEVDSDDSDDEQHNVEEGEEREPEPLLGHPVRVRDPEDVFMSAQDANGKPMKSYPLVSSRFQLGEFAGFVQEDKRGEDNDCFVLLDSNLNPEDFVYKQEDSESDSESEKPAQPLRRSLLPRKHPPVSDPAVTIFRKKHLSFVPNTYGAIQLGLFWRYNPRLPPAKLPESACRDLADEIFLEVISGLIASIGVSEHKDATDAPFSIQDWQGKEGNAGEGGGMMATMQSQQLMQLQLMQQMQRMQLAQLRAVEDSNNRPPPVVQQVAPVEVKKETPRPSTAERKRIEEEKEFLSSFTSSFEWYEGERYPINYLTPPDVAVLFETMGWQKCIAKVLDEPVDGPTLAVMTDEDLSLLGLKLPSQRKKLLQEIKLFKQIGAPQASLVNPESLDAYTKAAEELAQKRLEQLQSGELNNQAQTPAPFDTQALMEMMAAMNMMPMMDQSQNPQQQAQQQGQMTPLQIEEPQHTGPLIPLEALKTEAHASPHHYDVDSNNFKPTTPSNEPTEEYLLALADALDHLPKVFVAGGKPGKVHKARKGEDLSSEEIASLTSGDECIVYGVGTTMNSLGEEVDRFLISAPVIGWVTAANFKLAMDDSKQTPKYFKVIEKRMSAKDKKAKKKLEAEAKKKQKAEEAARKKMEKEEKAAAKKAEYLEKHPDKKRQEEEDARKQAEKEAGKKPGKAEWYGKWTAKGNRDVDNKVRMKAEMDSMVVGTVRGGQVVNVINEAFVKKNDGTEVRRLEINQPKAGWVTAQNFVQKGKEKGAADKEEGGGEN